MTASGTADGTSFTSEGQRPPARETSLLSSTSTKRDFKFTHLYSPPGVSSQENSIRSLHSRQRQTVKKISQRRTQGFCVNYPRLRVEVTGPRRRLWLLGCGNTRRTEVASWTSTSLTRERTAEREGRGHLGAGTTQSRPPPVRLTGAETRDTQDFLPEDVHLLLYHFPAPSPQTTKRGLSGDSEDRHEWRL